MAGSSRTVITPVDQFHADQPWRSNYSANPDQGTGQGWTRDILSSLRSGKISRALFLSTCTLADLEEKPSIEPQHVSEVIQYRTLDRNFWE